MISLFKPNKSQTGTLINFNFVSSRKEKNKAGLYLKIVRQCGPIGGSPFAGSKHICVIKFNELELAAILNAIERRTKWSTVHKNDKSSRSITFGTLYKKDEEGNPTKEVSGFSFNTSVGETKFNFSLNLNESVLVREFLKFTINHLFDGLYSAEKARMKEFAKDLSKDEEVVTEDAIVTLDGEL